MVRFGCNEEMAFTSVEHDSYGALLTKLVTFLSQRAEVPHDFDYD